MGAAVLYDPVCSVDGCGRSHRSRGLCGLHHQRWLAHGDPLKVIAPSERRRPEPISLAERFWPKVNKSGPVPEHRPELGPCWLWTGCVQRYGRIKLEGTKRVAFAHRVSYEWAKGPVPDGLELDHLCRVTACVNPDHLEAVTHSENELRKPRVSRSAQ